MMMPTAPGPALLRCLVVAALLLFSACGERAMEVEASCGQCNFAMPVPPGCDLAVRIEGKAYFVDGSRLDDHGDAHAKRGMCNVVRKARVTGEVVDDRFVAKTFKLID